MCEVEWSSEKPPVSLRPYLEAFSESYRMTIKITSTVGINPILSDLNTLRTSKWGQRYIEANKMDKNELQIRKNSQKGTETKMAEKLNNFEKLERKKSNFSPIINPETF